jgi:hypothetical protein
MSCEYAIRYAILPTDVELSEGGLHVELNIGGGQTGVFAYSYNALWVPCQT